MPAPVRGSPVLFLLAFSPFAIMVWWLVRLRFAKALAAVKAVLANATRRTLPLTLNRRHG
jgi:hypothetical protein